MDAETFHAATSGELDRLSRTLVATKTFVDTDELGEVHRADPWRIQVNQRGDVAVLGRWRDHLPILSVEALWCPLRTIPAAVKHFLDVAHQRGLADVLGPPTPIEEMRAYESAGMHAQDIVATLTLTRLAEVTEPLLPEGLTFRSAGHRDIPALLAVDARCFEPFWRYDARHMARFCETGHLTLAELAGEAVGYTLSTIDAGDGLLGRLCVTPQRRRRGVGSALLFDAVRSVREHGGTRLTLSTQTDNAASQALYRQAHFRDTGRRYAFLRFGSDDEGT